jgi:micrococcal nuclease
MARVGIVLLLAIAGALASGCGDDRSSFARTADARDGRVTEVVDGDTIRVRRSGRKETTVRLLGVDSPESRHPSRPVECGAPEASSSLWRLLFTAPADTDGDGLFDSGGGRGRVVSLEADRSQARVDRYGRVLAYVRLRDGRLVQGVQLARGWAEVYVFRRPFRVLRRLRARAREARRQGAGVWGLCGGEFHRAAEP